MGLFDRFKKDKKPMASQKSIAPAPAQPKRPSTQIELLKAFRETPKEEQQDFLMQIIREDRRPSMRTQAISCLEQCGALSEEYARELAELGKSTTYVVPVVGLMKEHCDMWREIISIDMIKALRDIIKSSTITPSVKMLAADQLKEIYGEGLFTDEIRKYNGTMISAAVTDVSTDDDNYGYGKRDAVKFWVR